jgi:hypothetical protein
MSPNTSLATASDDVADTASADRSLVAKKRVYDYDEDAETEVWQLSAIASDWTLTINRMAANCRNISDEVYPGIHVGDRSPFLNKSRHLPSRLSEQSL